MASLLVDVGLRCSVALARRLGPSSTIITEHVDCLFILALRNVETTRSFFDTCLLKRFPEYAGKQL